MKVAQEVLFAKNMLLRPSYAVNTDINAFCGTSGPESMLSFNSWSSALKRLRGFHLIEGEGGDTAEAIAELKFAREEMERRYYYAGFLGVALGVQVSGPVGRLKVKIDTMDSLYRLLRSDFEKSDCTRNGQPERL